MMASFGERKIRLVAKRYSIAVLISLCALFILPHNLLDTHAMSANEWMKENDLSTTAYIAGVVDTWIMAEDVIVVDVLKEKFGGDHQKITSMASLWLRDRKMFSREINQAMGLTTYSHLVKCITERRMPLGHIEEIIRRYLERSPDKWDSSVSRIALLAVADACQEHPKN
jgi:hypothetical protein